MIIGLGACLQVVGRWPGRRRVLGWGCRPLGAGAGFREDLALSSPSQTPGQEPKGPGPAPLGCVCVCV